MSRDFKRQSRTEKYLFATLYNLGLKPQAQYKINGMQVDFAFPESKIVIEVDGPHHETESQRKLDGKRDALLKSLGWTVYRYKSDYVHNNVEGVALHIRNRIKNFNEEKINKKLILKTPILDQIRRQQKLRHYKNPLISKNTIFVFLIIVSLIISVIFTRYGIFLLFLLISIWYGSRK